MLLIWQNDLYLKQSLQILVVLACQGLSCCRADLGLSDFGKSVLLPTVVNERGTSHQDCAR